MTKTHNVHMSALQRSPADYLTEWLTDYNIANEAKVVVYLFFHSPALSEGLINNHFGFKLFSHSLERAVRVLCRSEKMPLSLLLCICDFFSYSIIRSFAVYLLCCFSLCHFPASFSCFPICDFSTLKEKVPVRLFTA